MQNFEVTNNKQRNRFEVHDEGMVAFLEYQEDDQLIALIHTEVPGDIGGKGIANALAAYAFDHAEKNGLKVLPYCPFIVTYLKRHPDLDKFVHHKS